MTLVEFVPPTPHPLWELCPQMGITDVIVKVNPDLTGLPDPWRYETLSRIVYRLKDTGLNVVGLEGDPFDMSPIKEYGVGGELSRAEAQRRREEAIGRYRELLESMGGLGIKLLCYNFMVGKGWSRTGVREGRGGAKATYFSLRDSPLPGHPLRGQPPAGGYAPLRATKPLISHEQVWANYEYFIKAVMPTAEKCGVRMALHPDDPCLDSLGGYARIFGSIEAYDRAYALYPSPSNAVTFCQANFKLMLGNGERGTVLATKNAKNTKTLRPLRPLRQKIETLEDVARHFGKRIAFIHVRDVEGDKTDFTELFHDQGTTDQFALMRTYRELGLDVPLRGDHVPEMAYDRELTPEGTPGYFTLGRLFANGYLKALMQGTEDPDKLVHSV
ncbi:MAG: mannonate dehydratase [Kiritimatiellae bacterium]|nr:mannonate dehydratase [Kiritimatiellia bacterium]